MHQDEYIIINKTFIEELHKSLNKEYDNEPDNQRQSFLIGRIKQLIDTLNLSQPLIPEIKKAFDAGSAYATGSYKEFKQTHPNRSDYVSNLKIGI